MEINENFKEEDVDENRIPVLEHDLSEIKTLKNKYQDEIEDFIGKIVKEHAKKIRNRKEELFPSPRPVYNEERSQSFRIISERNVELQERIVKVQKQIV